MSTLTQATTGPASILDRGGSAPPVKKAQLVTAEEAIERAPAFAPLVALWRDRRGAEPAPCWRQMDFVDFRGWHSELVLSSFDGDAPDPRFRLVGETFAQLAGMPLKGMRFSEYSPQHFDRQLRDHFAKLRETAKIGLVEGSGCREGQEHVSLQVLELPFRDGGTRIERLVHVVKPL